MLLTIFIHRATWNIRIGLDADMISIKTLQKANKEGNYIQIYLFMKGIQARIDLFDIGSTPRVEGYSLQQRLGVLTIAHPTNPTRPMGFVGLK